MRTASKIHPPLLPSRVARLNELRRAFQKAELCRREGVSGPTGYSVCRSVLESLGGHHFRAVQRKKLL